MVVVEAVCECRSVVVSHIHTSSLAHRAISHLPATVALLSGTARQHKDGHVTRA